MDSITFLIGGKYSTSFKKFFGRIGWTGYANRSINWYKPLKRNFYELASINWGDVYGDNPYGTIGYPGPGGLPERFFSWENTWLPSFPIITTAAERLIERIDWIVENHSNENLRIRLIGHSAGCLVANRASQLIQDKAYKIEELILCASPVPVNAKQFGQYWNEEQIPYAFPELTSISDQRFLYIPVWNDRVLSVPNMGTRYDSEFVSTNYGSITAASVPPPDSLILSRGHWKPVMYSNWVRYYLPWYLDVSSTEHRYRGFVFKAKRKRVVV